MATKDTGNLDYATRSGFQYGAKATGNLDYALRWGEVSEAPVVAAAPLTRRFNPRLVMPGMNPGFMILRLVA